MILYLSTIQTPVRSIYDGPMPRQWARLYPTVATAFQRMEAQLGGLIYTGMFRTAEASFAARKKKTGVQQPAYSGHNYGFSVDIAVDATLEDKRWKYPRLLRRLSELGWYCHRRDGRRGMEDWHFNYFGPMVGNHMERIDTNKAGTWASAVEHMIIYYYGSELELGAVQIQAALKKLKMYGGEIDGVLGPLSKEGWHAFQRAWELDKQPFTDSITQRVLAYVAAQIEETGYAGSASLV